MQLAVESSRSLIDASSHKLVVTQPTPPIFLDADPTRLSQMIQNLLNNAAKYTPAGGNIWLTATRESDHVLISVRDSGIGIPNEQLPTIFEMFSQLAPALDRSQGGLGIGLSLVRALAQLHGGSVTASSAGVGLGSEFLIKLPVSASESDLATVEVLPSVAQQKQRRILVIDDNEDAATSLAMLLEAEGHAACTAGDGSSGIRLAAEFEADAVILDIGLPDINGYEVAKLFRQTPSGANLLLIALTGWGQEQDKQEAKAAGFDFHFTKPVDVRRLLEALVGHTG
jgi:CheY-like chemotaxis protein